LFFRLYFLLIERRISPITQSMGAYNNQDIKRIANSMRRRRDDLPDLPYSFLTGAGCSYTAGIPLAGKLTKLINEKYGEECKHRLGPERINDYGACMSVLSANECKSLFKPYLEDAKVNWGHLAIAAMMKSGYVGRVLTFNFDSILARACGLLGIYPATYDFVSGVTTRTDYISQTAILHLHGQGHSLAMLNSDRETIEHAKNLRPLIRDVLSRTPTIIIGYSGKSDAVFEVIEDLYDGAERLHWIAHDKDCEAHISRLLKKRENSSEFLGDADSDTFLVELARELECWPPKMFLNPYEHLLDELAPVANHPGSDTDLFEKLKSELNSKAKIKEKESLEPEALILKGKWQKAIDVIGPKPEGKKVKDLLSVAKKSLADEIRHEQKTKTKAKSAALEEACKLYNSAVELNPEFYNAYNNWGIALRTRANLQKNEEMKKGLLKQACEKYERAAKIQPKKYTAHFNWGNVLAQLGKMESSIETIETSLEKYTTAEKLNSTKHLILYNWGGALLTAYVITNTTKYLDQAIGILERARSIDPNRIYNLACAFALCKNYDEVKKHLQHCKKFGTLPHSHFVKTDPDLIGVKDADWFQELFDS